MTATIPSRKADLHHQSVGDVYSVVDYKGGIRSLEFDDVRGAMTDAMRGGVAIYTINPCGLSPGGALGESDVAKSSGCVSDLGSSALDTPYVNTSKPMVESGAGRTLRR